MRTATGTNAVPLWTARRHSIKVFSSCVCAMVSVPTRYVAPPVGGPSPRPTPCRKARGVQRVLGAGGARRGEQPRTERSSCHLSPCGPTTQLLRATGDATHPGQ
jgi:hypothetical protein